MKAYEGLRSKPQHNISKEDIKSVAKVLESHWLTQGKYVEEFESSLSSYCKAKYAISSNSATSALILAYKALNLGKGDYLWTSANTFVATSNAALICGAEVDFVDIDRNTFNLDIDVLERKLKNSPKKRLPKIVVPVHFSGFSCDMARLYKLSKKYKFKIVEDASHAIGASYKRNKVGHCKFSEATIFSFHPVKIITTGEGGMLLTNNKKIAEVAHMLRSHGITRNKDLLNSKNEGAWYYEQLSLGYNFRLTDVQASLGLSQLKRLDSFVKKRRTLAKRYFKLLENTPFELPPKEALSNSSWHFFSIRINNEYFQNNKKEFFINLFREDVPVNVHYIPVHLQPFYKQKGFKEGYCPEAEKFYEECISLPIYYNLSSKDQQFIVNKLVKSLKI